MIDWRTNVTWLTIQYNTSAEISTTNIFQSLLMFYCIIKLSKSLYFVSIMQKYIWMQYYN